jgi:hypothetical protein
MADCDVIVKLLDDAALTAYYQKGIEIINLLDV